MKWSSPVASGRITRSADECEMSRSCHSGMSSSAACAYPRITRASPDTRSDTTGFRLCGMALEPFWPAANGSCTSRTSVRARCRISVAIASSVDAVMASADTNSAWRSRWITWVLASSGRRPSLAQTSCSTRGSTAAYVPTTPLIAPTLTISRARRRRSRSRSSSNAMTASLCPKLVGSAWMPWERPIITVSRCCSARRFTMPSSVSSRSSSRSADARSCSARPVSSTSEDVIPKWTHRPSGPTESATTWTNAATS